MIALTAFGSSNHQSFAQGLLLVFAKDGAFLLIIILITRYLLPNLLHNLAHSTELLILLSIRARITAIDSLKSLEIEADGDLKGKGRWTFSEAAEIVTVQYN